MSHEHVAGTNAGQIDYKENICEKKGNDTLI